MKRTTGYKTIGYKMVDDGRRQEVFDAIQKYCKKDEATNVIDFAMEVAAALFGLMVETKVYRIDVMPEIVGEDETGLFEDEVVIDKTLLLELLQKIYPHSIVGFNYDWHERKAKVCYLLHQACAQVRSEDGEFSMRDSVEVSRLIRMLQSVKRELE